MIKTDWLFAKQGYSKCQNDFLKVLDYLDKVNNETLNTTTLVDALLIPVHKLREIVIRKVYLPFVIQSILCVHYFSFRLAETEANNTFWSIIEGLAIIIFSFYFLWLEYLQFSDADGGFCKGVR